MILTYLAAPLSPEPGETLAGNLERARFWYAELSNRVRDRSFVADWILHCEVFAGDKDDDPELRSLGMLRNFALISVCHEVALVGPRISRGMRGEADFFLARNKGRKVYDLTNQSPISAAMVLTGGKS